ncbi:MAG: right-handed parallel beta-helix repeat-containing protein, partial [Parafilimonas sp.]|nr:right-handed parallel beta-helix repeat-containing protein [Parafilimonas sp.]
MLVYSYYNFCFVFCMILSSCNKTIPPVTNQQISLKRTSYYFSNAGNDTNDGSINHPFKTLSIISILRLNAGDSILLKGNEVFNDSIVLTANATTEKPITITSYGNGHAIINAGNGTSMSIYQSSFINVQNIICEGSGRKSGNTKPGLLISDCNNINIENIDVSGFQKSGLQLYNCVNTKLNNISAHDNGAAGIGVEGDFSNKRGSRNISIANCTAVNNPGDPTNLDNHSGNGIVVGHSTNVLIDHCMATNNGWDMPRIGNGPVGIWAYEADSVIIQHCLSYKNKTSPGAADGGGYDLDGGVTNSIVQYCLSYQNQGSGYCIFQYWGASPWYNNVFRFNISIDDGLVSDSRAGIYVWNSSKDSSQFYNCDVYNNTVYNSQQAVLSFSETSQRKNFRFLNNIFIGDDSLIRGRKNDDKFLANDWWSLKKKFNTDGMNDFNAWISK